MLNFNMLSLSKRERKANYSVDNYFKDTLRAGPSKTEKVPKLPRAPKQIAMSVSRRHVPCSLFSDTFLLLSIVRTFNSFLLNLPYCKNGNLLFTKCVDPTISTPELT